MAGVAVSEGLGKLDWHEAAARRRAMGVHRGTVARATGTTQAFGGRTPVVVDEVLDDLLESYLDLVHRRHARIVVDEMLAAAGLPSEPLAVRLRLRAHLSRREAECLLGINGVGVKRLERAVDPLDEETALRYRGWIADVDEVVERWAGTARYANTSRPNIGLARTSESSTVSSPLRYPGLETIFEIAVRTERARRVILSSDPREPIGFV